MKAWFDANRRTIGWLVVVVAILIAGVLGVNYPIPPMPAAPAASSQAIGGGGVQDPATFKGLTAINYLTSNGPTTLGGDLSVVGSITAASIVTQGNASLVSVSTTGNITTSGSLSLAGATFSGPIKYGTLAVYTSGLSISHGFVTTPTMCILEPIRDVTSTLTITATGFSSNMASVATPIYWMCGK